MGPRAPRAHLTTLLELTGHLVHIAHAGQPPQVLRVVKRRQSLQRRPHEPLRTAGPRPACRTRSPSAGLRARSARAQGVLQLLTPRAPVLVLQPQPPRPRLKRKKQSIMGNGVLHSKHQKRAKPTPPSPSIPRLVGEKPRGRGVLFAPPRAPPRPAPPQVPAQPRCPRRRRKRTPPPLPPSSALLPLGGSQVPPAPSPPPRSPPTRQSTLPAPGDPHEGPRFCPRPALAGGTRGDPAPPSPLPAPAPHAPRALRGPGGALPAAEPEEEEKRGGGGRVLATPPGRGRTSPPSASASRRRGPLAQRPPLEERSVPSALCPKLYPWEKPAPPPLIAQGKKPAPAHPAAQELGNGTPTPPQRKPHRVAVTHGQGAACVFPSFAPSCRL